jgi:hypothetical protein
MKNLKNLTPEQCIEIATIVKPDVEWKFIKSSNEWEGFDLIEKSDDESGICNFIFQIEYSNKDIKLSQRFRLYIDLYEYPLSEEKLEKIVNYLEI